MASLLTQVTMVPRATVISLGMKVLWSMLTTGLAPASCWSSARPGVDARAVNRRATPKALRTLCSLKLHSPREVTLFAVKYMESRTIKTNLLVWVQVEAICRGASTVPLRPNGRLAQKTPDRAMKFPSSNTFLIIEDKQLQRINSADVQTRVRRIFTERPARRSRWNKKKRGPSFGRKAGARCSLRRLVSVRNAGNA